MVNKSEVEWANHFMGLGSRVDRPNPDDFKRIPVTFGESPYRYYVAGNLIVGVTNINVSHRAMFLGEQVGVGGRYIMKGDYLIPPDVPQKHTTAHIIGFEKPPCTSDNFVYLVVGADRNVESSCKNRVLKVHPELVYNWSDYIV